MATPENKKRAVLEVLCTAADAILREDRKIRLEIVSRPQGIWMRTRTPITDDALRVRRHGLRYMASLHMATMRLHLKPCTRRDAMAKARQVWRDVAHQMGTSYRASSVVESFRVTMAATAAMQDDLQKVIDKVL